MSMLIKRHQILPHATFCFFLYAFLSVFFNLSSIRNWFFLRTLKKCSSSTPLKPNEYCMFAGLPHTCTRLSATQVTSKTVPSPEPGCLGGKESWDICTDGKFLCQKQKRDSKACTELQSQLHAGDFCSQQDAVYFCTDLGADSDFANKLHIAPSPRCLDGLLSSVACPNGEILCQPAESTVGWRHFLLHNAVKHANAHLYEVLTEHKLCIVLPFRDHCAKFNRAREGERTKHLEVFINYMQAFLREAGHTNFEVLIIRQVQRGLFNKGLLFNAGAFVSVLRNCDYVALHDVDRLPLNRTNNYSWPTRPLHLDTNPGDCCYDFAGGAVLMQLRHYVAINGFCNKYYGWGGEDADLYYRVVRVFGTFERLEPEDGRYLIQGHSKVDNETQKDSHSDNMQVLMNFRNSEDRRLMDSDGYSNWMEYAQIVNSTVEKNVVFVDVEVLRNGILMEEC